MASLPSTIAGQTFPETIAEVHPDVELTVPDSRWRHRRLWSNS